MGISEWSTRKEKSLPYFIDILPPGIENEEIILYWDKAVLPDRMVRHNRSDIIPVEQKKKKALIIDIAVPNDGNIRSAIEGFTLLIWLVLISQYVVCGQMNGCKCSEEYELRSCHCEGRIPRTPINLNNGTLQRLSIENGEVTEILNNFDDYKYYLIELTITRSHSLKFIHEGLFQGMPLLNSLRVTHTSLKNMPKMEGLGMFNTMNIIDFESNKIEAIESNNLAVRAAHFSIDYNNIRAIAGWAFNGSEIEKLSLKGNRELSELSENAFNGLRSLRDLDLSETSITYLPTLGLEDLEVLRIMDTYTLKIIPSIYYLNKLQTAQLTYSFHCCAFHNPEKHDPRRHQEYLKLQKEYCDVEQIRTIRDMFEQSFGEIVAHNESAYSDNNLTKDLLINGNNEMEYEENTDETFHSEIAELPKSKIHVLCGNLTGKFVSCLPKADELNPCEDMMSWSWLRMSVWFVLTTAIFGNITVLVVLALSRSEKSVPRFLMCNLAFADLLIALYLTMLAIMDIISSDVYFNYAYDWQRGYGCKISGFLTVFASQLSLFTLSLLTIERWFAIRHALYLNLMDLKLTSNIMIGGWIYSLIAAALPLFGVSNYSSTSICLPMDTHDAVSQAYIVTMVLVSGCAFLLMCVCYTQIYLSLSEETRHSIGEGSIARKMTILVGTNFVCWAPVAFFSLTAVAGYPFITVSQSKILLVFVYPINSCANPFLYAILTKQFRKDFMTLFKRYSNCKRRTYHYKMGYSRPTSNDTPGPITTAESLL